MIDVTHKLPMTRQVELLDLRKNCVDRWWSCPKRLRPKSLCRKVWAQFGHSRTNSKGSHRCKPLICWLRGQDLNL